MSTIARMTARQRVCAAFARGEPDRVPIMYEGNACIDRRLRAHFGVDTMVGVRERLGCDIINIFPSYSGPALHAATIGTDRLVDPAWGIVRRWVENPSGGYWDFCDFPLAAADADAARSWSMPDPAHFDYNGICHQLAAVGDLAVLLGSPGIGDVINSSGMLFGMEQVLIRLIDGDAALADIVDRRISILCVVVERMLDLAGERIDGLWIGEDLGTQIGPMISMAMFHEHIAPRLQRFIDLACRHDKPVVMHSCGSSHHFFDELSAMGVCCMQTLQPEAAGMQPARLKRIYGDRLAFMGGLSTAGVLASGSIEAVRAEVRNVLAAYMPGGGYVFGPTHMVQDDTPTDNVLAAFDAARCHGVYA
ncbi:MAG: hypothetical protein PF961_05300 [Planctomycetota bacterium]|jgi:uroporphyrinogen decarboxylase|nr:hypothetical protein [Planctomycetota bacterium]